MVTEIRNVDAGLKALIDNKNYTLHQEGMEARVLTRFSTPDDILAKKQYPMINIESGFTLETPIEWQADVVDYTINGDDSQKADKTATTISDLLYGYKVGFYVQYKAQCTYLEREFLRLFPMFFGVPVTIGTTVYSIPFERKGIVNMDGFDEDHRLYRRDFLLMAQIAMEDVVVETDYRPYTSVTVDISMSTIL